MAIVPNTFLTFDAKGLREELADRIYDISPEETPFVSNGGRGSVEHTLFEWQMDVLAAAAANDVVEGDDVTSYAAVVPTSRVGNYAQISRKTLIVSGSEEEANKAGRRSEVSYQLARRSLELKRDMEFICLSNVGGRGGNSTTSRLTATMGAWVKSNDDFGAGGASPVWSSGVPSAGRTDGTQRAFTEAFLKNAIRLLYTSGGRTRMLLVGPFNKQVASGFAGVATKTFYQSAREATAIIGAADVYVSDFGTLSIVPDLFQRDRDAWLVDPEFYEIEYFRPFMTEELAKTGDARKNMILAEWGLKVHNEAAHALVADLTTV